MKAFVIAETADAQKELCAGARTLADEVLLVSIGSAPRTGVADKAYAVELPQGELVENAYDAVAALYDEVAPNTVLFEPTPRLKIVGGRLAAHADASVMCDVTALDGAEAESLYFGGLATKRQRAVGPWPSTPAAAPPSTASRPRAPTSWKSARSSPRKNPSSYAARMKFRTRAPT